jgi:hypothetical protein
MLLVEILEITGAMYNVVQARLHRGWDIEDAVSAPVRAKVKNGMGCRKAKNILTKP